MTNYFPFNYISTIFSPIRMFTNRGYLNGWQRIILFLVMLSFIMLPLSIQIANRDYVDIGEYYPGVVAQFNPTLMEQLPLSDFENGEFTHLDSKVLQQNQDYIVATSPKVEEAEKWLTDHYGLVLTPSYFFMRDVGADMIYQPYLRDGKLKQIRQPNQFQEELSRYWFEANRIVIVLYLLMNVYLLVTFNLMGIILMGSFFIKVMGYYVNFDINTYQEALDITFNTIGLPTLVVTFIALISGNPIWVISGHTVSFILMFMLMMWQTRLNDKYSKNKLGKTN